MKSVLFAIFLMGISLPLAANEMHCDCAKNAELCKCKTKNECKENCECEKCGCKSD